MTSMAKVTYCCHHVTAWWLSSLHLGAISLGLFLNHCIPRVEPHNQEQLTFYGFQTQIAKSVRRKYNHL